MAEAVEGGAALAWRLLATLEGSSLLLATTALLAYTARSRVTGNFRRNIKKVLVTNTTNTLGKELKMRLESHGCVVTTVTGGATSRSDSDKIDALVIIGAENKQEALDGVSKLVTEDIHYNLKLLEDLAPLLQCGGCIAWACTGAARGAFGSAATAFDAVLRVSLQQIARGRRCEPIWIGREEDADLVAERLVSLLLPCTNRQRNTGFSIRNAAQNLTDYLGRWLKVVT